MHFVLALICCYCICSCSSNPTNQPPTDFPEDLEETHLLDPDFIPRIEHKCKGNLICFIKSICNAENLICDSLIRFMEVNQASSYSITIVFSLVSLLLIGIIGVFLSRGYTQFRNSLFMRKIYSDANKSGGGGAVDDNGNGIFVPTTTTAYSPMIPTEMFPLPPQQLQQMKQQQQQIVKTDAGL